MAGPGGAICADQAMWRAFLAAKYFQIPPGACTTCRNSTEMCGKFFCVQCRVGNVCEATFQSGGEHCGHPGIRVWVVTGVHVVCVDDVKRFMATSLVNQIQLYKQNNRLNIKLFRSDYVGEKASTSRQRVCFTCEKPISWSKTRNYSERPVCSLMCLLDDALTRSVRFILRAIDTRMPEEWLLIAKNDD